MRLASIAFVAVTFATLPARLAVAQELPATFVGKVFTEDKLRPIVAAEVTILELDKSVLANEKGAFRLADIKPGVYTVRVRHIGYARFEARLNFEGGATVERAIVLPAVTALDTARVVGEVNLPMSFLEHRASGRGHFLSREQLDQRGDLQLANLLGDFPAAGLVRGRSGQSWVMSKRYTGAALGGKGAGASLWIPSAAERSWGMVAGCYARVYLDKALLNGGITPEPVDLRLWTAKNVEAVEWYDGPSSTPNEYSRLNSSCGVLVIHTRRSD